MAHKRPINHHHSLFRDISCGLVALLASQVPFYRIVPSKRTSKAQTIINFYYNIIEARALLFTRAIGTILGASLISS